MLNKNFVQIYKTKKNPFGFGDLSALTFARTYSRDGEDWVDVCERCINGMKFSLSQRGIFKDDFFWELSFDSMFHLKWSPPGRGLWMQGSDFIMKRQHVEALQNCGFISSEYIGQEGGDFFSWIMEMLMLGVGIGFDTRGSLKRYTLFKPSEYREKCIEIEDSREGWAKSVSHLFNSYFRPYQPTVKFDYSKIRPKGSVIKGFGGIASGKEPLEKLHVQMRNILNNNSILTSTVIVDICNLIGCCVIAGNVRRSAQIALGFPDDTAFLNLKNYSLNPQRKDFGWSSNNSLIVEVGQDYGNIIDLFWDNGEPGLLWLDNIQKYARMNGERDYSDGNAKGVNPCGEQPLHHKELCNLVEVFLPRCSDQQEFLEALRHAYYYGKTVALDNDKIFDTDSRNVMMDNLRIGISVTGVTDFIYKNGRTMLIRWLDIGYEFLKKLDSDFSKKYDLNESIRLTTVKPSGTLSLLAGCSPGAHFPLCSQYYIRRVTLSKNSPYVPMLEHSGYYVEDSVYSSDSCVVEFPILSRSPAPSEDKVSLQTQYTVISTLQQFWADNAVSATIKFDKSRDSKNDLYDLLRNCENTMKGLSFLPLSDNGYLQSPYESISKDTYYKKMNPLKPLRLNKPDHDTEEKYCNNDVCLVS